MAKKLRVKKWIATGELDAKHKDQDDILDDCGRLLDKAYTSEILGEVLFQATDGKYYTITVEAVIGRANPEYVKETLEEHKKARREKNPATGPGDLMQPRPMGG